MQPKSRHDQFLLARGDVGSCYAMERRGCNFLRDGDPVQAEVGCRLLRDAVALGSVTAMFSLSVRLLDSTDRAVRQEGMDLLRLAAQQGSLRAMTELGVRRVLAEGFDRDHEGGVNLLQKASASGDRSAGLLLQTFAGKHSTLTGEVCEHVGLAFFWEGVSAPSVAIRRRYLDQASRLFFDGYARGHLGCSSHLAELVRRQTIPASNYPDMDTLLRDGLSARFPLAEVNQALRMASGVDCRLDWRQADDLISRLEHVSGVSEWWRMLSRFEEPEAHLVIGWLVRHGLATDPDYLDLEARLNRARPVFDVPDWLHG